MSTIIWIVILIVALAAGIGAGYFIGYNNRKKTAEAQIGSAEAEATCGSRLAGMLSTNQVKLLEPEPQPVRAKTNAMVSTTAEKRIRECFKKMRSL